jgi:transcriptional regulator with GAF, ATPase, and Fis domain
MEAIDRARHAIEDRLKDLREEERRLEQALKHLVGRDGAKPKKGRTKSSPTRARTRKRAPRGQREKQLLASIKKHPDYKQADHAREIGVKPSQVYGLVNRLSKDGKVKKSKDGKLSVA